MACTQEFLGNVGWTQPVGDMGITGHLAEKLDIIKSHMAKLTDGDKLSWIDDSLFTLITWSVLNTQWVTKFDEVTPAVRVVRLNKVIPTIDMNRFNVPFVFLSGVYTLMEGWFCPVSVINQMLKRDKGAIAPEEFGLPSLHECIWPSCQKINDSCYFVPKRNGLFEEYLSVSTDWTYLDVN